MKIFNIPQANTLINNKCVVIGCGLGNRFKVYIDFLEDQHFWEILNKWLAKEI